MAIYENIRVACKEAGLSVSKLEEELGFARGSIYKWDTNVPSVTRVKQVSERLNVSMEKLLDGYNPEG